MRLQRRNVVLAQMEKYAYLSSEETDSLQALPLQLDYANLDSEGIANYFLARVKKKALNIIEAYNQKNGTKWDLNKDGLIINTTLNYQLQKNALSAFASHLAKMQKQLNKQYQSGASRKTLYQLAKKQLPKGSSDVARPMELFSWDGFYTDSITVLDSIAYNLKLLQAGLIGLNPKSGEIMAWVGGIDFRTQPYDQVLAQRQMASSFKPIIYAAALEEGLQPCDYLDNEAIILSDYENWSPENYDHSTGGNYSMAGALSKSVNIPTVNLYFLTGFEAVDYLWKKMGFSARLKNTPATSLGINEASLLETSVAYAAFANNGNHVEPRLLLSIESPDGEVIYQAPTAPIKERILAESTSELINAMLQKAIDNGTGIAMRSTYGVNIPLAGKTGTSQNYSDAWFIGYNPDIVIATRVGASTPLIHFNSGTYGSGSRLALPLTALTLQESQKNKSLKKEINAPFPMLTPELISLLDCPDYQEDSYFENLFEQFRKETTTEKKKVKKAQRKKKKKKKSLFERIFK